MSKLRTALLVLVAASCPAAATVIESIDWSRVEPSSGEIVELGRRTALRLDGVADRESRHPLLVLDGTGVEMPVFGIRTEVRYEGVESGYLEMWVTLADGGRYFSRSLADSGPLARLEGDSDWRPLALPFSTEGSAAAPTSLELTLVLAGGGRVWIGPLELAEAAELPTWLGAADRNAVAPWWSADRGGWIGAIAGVLLGLLGAAGGLLSARGLARRAVLLTADALILLAAFAAAGGGIAIVEGQPYAVWYPLLLGGGLVLALGLGARITFGRAYTRHELRRMQARDAG